MSPGINLSDEPVIRPTTQLIDKFAMNAAKRFLESRGYRNIIELVNESNNGVDIVAWKRLPSGREVPVFFEVKGHWQSGPPGLRGDQRSREFFVRDRVRRILQNEGNRWGTVDQEIKDAAEKIQRHLDAGGRIHGVVVNVDYALNNELRHISVRTWPRTFPSVPPFDIGD